MQQLTARQPLGQTGLDIPPIVFGSSCLGNLYQAIPYETKLAIAREWVSCVQQPVIDSAGKYGAGLALEAIGACLRDLGVRPGDVMISNKLAWKRIPLTTPEPTFEPGAWIGLEHDAEQDISYSGILECYEQGCDLLGDYAPEVVSVHDPDEYLAQAEADDERKARFDDVLGAYQALGELKAKGHVKAVGVGSKDWAVIQAYAVWAEVSATQLRSPLAK